VVTHEHRDHVSGIADARDIFDPMEMGETWLGWTETPANPLARILKRQNQQKLQARHLALACMAHVQDPQSRAYGQGVEELLGFFGGPALGATLAAFQEKTAEAMAAAASRAEPNAWQRIDHDWLLSVAQLGLQLDSATKNTSLVLAFELGDHGPVLLFAADAQIGSWKSWLTLTEFNVADLLRRTVYYKVGHHGSHNAP
jgi:beta-lactamase superfamily II metal-dependent hydrolase